MCGIIGYLGERQAAPILLQGLQALEYRGYDSAGIAVVCEDAGLAIHKSAGKLSARITLLGDSMPTGTEGIGHTRWATHGKPSDENAHPQVDCRRDVVVIHNGIVENYLDLKRELAAQGHAFTSQTDTEVVPHLIEHYMLAGAPLEEAVRLACQRLLGAHALLVMSRSTPGKLVAVRIGNAGGVVVGYGASETLVASDLPALLPLTRHVVFLSSQEMAVISAGGVTYRTLEGQGVMKSPQTLAADPLSAAKAGYKHFMLKEIAEQPEAVMDCIRGRVNFEPVEVTLDGLPVSAERLCSIERVVLLGMGTSWNAAMVGRHFIEEMARLPVTAENASEFRYRDPPLDGRTLVVALSQSGETVDTLGAMEEAQRRGALQVALCNVPGSQATRLADGVIYLRAGLEIGVAASKTLTTSLVALYLLAMRLGETRGVLDAVRVRALAEDLAKLPHMLGAVLEQDACYQAVAHDFWDHNNFLYLGRGINYPIALEGALKLKELSYIHAEGYPAGEMKHGPIALVDGNMPVVAIASRGRLYDKMLSTIEQVKARDGIVLALATEGDSLIPQKADRVIYLPAAPELVTPILNVVPLQLLAYHIAVKRGCDVDQPRNLAKSVTVE
jgi:glucosamine--fructose-6-phosphate aminotransferase (isomerizing)